MHRFRMSLVALVLLLGSASTAAGQSSTGGMESNRLVSFGIGGGVSVPVSDARDAFQNGVVGHGFARLNLKQLPIAPRVEFTFTRFDLKDAHVTGGGTGTLLAGLAGLQFYLMHGPVRPYLLVGLGAYDVKTDVNGQGVVPASSVSSTHVGVNGGAGVLVRLGPLASAFVEARVDNVFTDKGAITSNQVQLVPVTFGVVF